MESPPADGECGEESLLQWRRESPPADRECGGVSLLQLTGSVEV